MYKWLILFLIVPFGIYGQGEFTFGVRTHVILSQVDGDNLTGFSKVGYDLGIEGGYILSPSSRIIIGQGFSKIGSNSKNPQVGSGDYIAKVDLLTANLFLGYAHHFNLGWENSRSHIIQLGVRYHYVIKNNSSLIYNSFDTDLPLNLEEIKNQFPSLHLGFSRKIVSDLRVEIFGEYGLNYLLDASPNQSSKLIPYHLSLGVAYQL